MEPGGAAQWLAGHRSEDSTICLWGVRRVGWWLVHTIQTTRASADALRRVRHVSTMYRTTYYDTSTYRHRSQPRPSISLPFARLVAAARGEAIMDAGGAEVHPRVRAAARADEGLRRRRAR